MRIIIVKARTLIIVSLLLLIIPAVLLAPRAVQSFSPQEVHIKPVDSVKTTEPKIALTYDCEDTDEGIDEILDVLSEQQATAAFFVTSELVREYPETVKRIFDEGHVVGALSSGSEQNIRLIDELVSDTCGAAPLYVRLLSQSDSMVQTVTDMGKICIGESIDSGDYKDSQTEEALLTRLVNTRAGDIILMHSSSELSVRLLPKIIKGLKKTYEFVSLDELISEKYT